MKQCGVPLHGILVGLLVTLEQHNQVSENRSIQWSRSIVCTDGCPNVQLQQTHQSLHQCVCWDEHRSQMIRHQNEHNENLYRKHNCLIYAQKQRLGGLYSAGSSRSSKRNWHMSSFITLMMWSQSRSGIKLKLHVLLHTSGADRFGWVPRIQFLDVENITFVGLLTIEDLWAE